jgi:signal transduction histidine kinase
MKRISLLFLFISLTAASYGNHHTNQDKNILILFSSSPITPAYRVILEGIRENLSNEFGDHYTLHTEYLETDLFPKGNYPHARFDKYNNKYRNVDLDILICVGIGIVPAIKQNADAFLLSLPTLSIDIDFSPFGYKTDLVINDQTAVFRIKIDPIETISTALRLFPETHTIYVISGVSGTDKVFLDMTKQAASSFQKKYKFEYLTDLSMDEILKRVHNIRDGSIILVSNFNADINQVPYYNPEAMHLISEAAAVPVFSYSSLGIGYGAIGGYVVSFKKASMYLGEIAVKILKGIEPNAIHFGTSASCEYIFDWRELERWNLSNSNLIPANSTILFQQMGFFRKYRLFVIGGAAFILIQTFLIVSLILMIRRQKLMTSQLVTAENKYRELVREDRILRIGQISATLAHELNQPLTAILSTAQAGIRFIESNKHDPVLMKELFQNIAEDDKRTASILSSIRGMLKLEKRDKEIVNLNNLTRELVMVFRSEAVENNILLEEKLLPEPVFVFADPIQLQQVIMNFLINASQSLQKTDTMKKNIMVSESIREDQVIIAVSDNGEGISDTFKPDLFKPFITSKKDGFGIGLTISQSIIEDHHGKIWAENLPGGGAVFSFMLKIYSDDQ